MRDTPELTDDQRERIYGPRFAEHDTDDPADCWCSPIRWEPGLWLHQDERMPPDSMVTRQPPQPRPVCPEHGMPASIWHGPQGCHPDALQHEPRPSFTCPRCSRTSYNTNDVREGYCGACRDWTGL